MTYAVTPENEAATGRRSEVLTLGGVASNLQSESRPRTMPLFVSSDQLYYWSFTWQDAERKAMEDLRAGRAHTFDDPTAAVRYLLGSDR
jgi:hypothetical protein